jgi:hypothetical protein
MHPCTPLDTSRAAKTEQRTRLQQLAVDQAALGREISINRMKEWWIVGWHFTPDLVVPDKSWEEHRRALYASDPQRDHYNVKQALRILLGEEDADPFAQSNLNAKQLIAARRMWRNQSDYVDRAVIDAVGVAMRGQRKKNLTIVANAAHAAAQDRKREADELANASDTQWMLKLIKTYQATLESTTDGAYHLKMLFESVPAGPVKELIRNMLLGPTIAVSKALEALELALVS